MARGLLIALSLAVSACHASIGEQPESQVTGADAGAPDDPPAADAAPAPGVPDAAVPVAQPDAAVPMASPEEQCATRYGAVPGFELCTATDGVCTFIAIIEGVSCGTYCTALGGACLGAIDNEVGSCTDLENDPTADCATTDKTDLLCTCTLPAGP